jgi:hypothetical protein
VLHLSKTRISEVGELPEKSRPRTVVRIRAIHGNQRRVFLKDLGLTAVPKKKALREFERRLNLKAVMEKPLNTQEQKLFESMR